MRKKFEKKILRKKIWRKNFENKVLRNNFEKKISGKNFGKKNLKNKVNVPMAGHVPITGQTVC